MPMVLKIRDGTPNHGVTLCAEDRPAAGTGDEIPRVVVTIRMAIHWLADGVTSVSEHASGRLVVRYLLHLHRVGDDIRILWIR